MDLSNLSDHELLEHLAHNREDAQTCEMAKLFGLEWYEGYYVPDRLAGDLRLIAEIECEIRRRGEAAPAVSWWGEISKYPLTILQALHIL